VLPARTARAMTGRHRMRDLPQTVVSLRMGARCLSSEPLCGHRTMAPAAPDLALSVRPIYFDELSWDSSRGAYIGRITCQFI